MFVLAVGSVAADASEVTGVVTSHSRSALPGANVTIIETGRTALTDSSGRFFIPDVEPGEYTLRVQYLGYPDKTQSLTVPANITRSVEIRMGTDVMVLDAVVVEGYREGQSKALQQKRNAQNLMDIISSDAAGKLPDSNVAEALRRVAGLSIDMAAGEGQSVIIRGIEPNYNTVTFNGNTLAAPGHLSSDRPDALGVGEGRAMPLDTITSAQISEIEVIKAVTPDMDGHALGGSINIKTASAFNRTERILQGSVETGVNDATGDPIYAAGTVWGDRFGADKQFGLVVGAQLSRAPYGNDALRAGFGNFDFPRNFYVQPKTGNRDRIGLTLNFEYRPSSDFEFYVRTIGNQKKEVQDFQASVWVLRNLGNPDLVEHVSPTSLIAKRMRFTQEAMHDENDQKLINISTGGRKRSGDLTVTGDLTYSLADDTLSRDGVTFNTPNIMTEFPLDYSGFYPSFPAELGTTTPDRLTLNRYTIEDRWLKSTIWTPRVDLKWDFDQLFGGRKGFIKTGMKFTGRYRSISISSTRSGGPVTMAEMDAAGPGFSVWDDRYTTTLGVNLDRALEYFHTDPDGLLVENLVDKAQNETGDTYQVQEDIYAPYVMGQIDLSERLTALGGVRFERTDVDLTSYEAVVIGADLGVHGSGVLAGVNTRVRRFTYNSFLPNLQFKYELSDHQLIRFASTTTFGRPPYEAAAAGGRLRVNPIVPPLTDPNFPFQGSVRTGNPGLQPFEAINFDLTYEHYLKSGGLLSAGVFHKIIKNPIYTFRETFFNIEYEGLNFEELTFNSKRNADDGYVSGIELGSQIPFSAFTGGFLGGFGFNANVTIMRSQAKLDPTTENRELTVRFFKQPHLIYNLALYYQNHRFSARVAYNNTGNSLQNVGNTVDTDLWISERGQLDVQASYRINDRYRIFASAQNLGNEPRMVTQGKEGLKLRRGNIYGSDYRIGIRFEL